MVGWRKKLLAVAQVTKHTSDEKLSSGEKIREKVFAEFSSKLLHFWESSIEIVLSLYKTIKTRPSSSPNRRWFYRSFIPEGKRVLNERFCRWLSRPTSTYLKDTNKKGLGTAECNEKMSAPLSDRLTKRFCREAQIGRPAWDWKASELAFLSLTREKTKNNNLDGSFSWYKKANDDQTLLNSVIINRYASYASLHRPFVLHTYEWL